MSDDDKSLNPSPLMPIITGFWASKTLAAAVSLDVFTQVSQKNGLTISDFADSSKLHQRPASMLLAACASLGLLYKDGESYRNSAHAEEYLVKGNKFYLGGFIQLMDDREYPAWGNLLEALRSNGPVTWNPADQDNIFATDDEPLAELFYNGMHSLSTFTARALAAHVELTGVRRLLDIGGGTGPYDIILCQQYPDLRATLYDLPMAHGRAQRRITEHGLQDRIDVVAGDFLTEELPTGHDFALLSKVLHDWDEKTNREILRKAFAALEPGGRLAICELVVNDERTGPVAATLMSLNMLVETAGGANYTEGEYRSWLTDSGFVNIETIPLDSAGATSVILAHKPA